MTPKATSQGKIHRFGGNWTSLKLEVLAKYLKAYTTVLKKTPFKIAYIDAFAGTGYRKPRKNEKKDSNHLLFPDLAEDAPQELLDGSARQALKIEPEFDQYIFIEKDSERCSELKNLGKEFPELAKRIRVEEAEANQKIQEICRKDWKSNRAVLFLDPYGMQVEWETIEAIASTKAIDLWILFPLGMGVNRVLTRSGEIPDLWRNRLDLLLGTTDWYDEFYQFESEPNLFGDDNETVIKASMATIGRYFNERLRTIFPGVAEKPAVLKNNKNNPLYLLCFASGNEKGSKIALKIANHILKGVQ